MICTHLVCEMWPNYPGANVVGAALKFRKRNGNLSLCVHVLHKTLKCPYDQIFDFHFFTFSCTIRPSYSSCQISIHYEHQKSFYFNIYFQEFTAAINQLCSKAWLQMGESDVKDSNIPHEITS